MDSRGVPNNFRGLSGQRLAQMNSCCAPTPRVSLSPVRVIVAGDHECLRSSIRTILEMDSRITVVAEAADDCDLVKMANRLRPDVVLMDLDMRCCDSFEAVSEISRRHLSKAIVGLTIHDECVERNAAQQAGVDLFLEKGISSKKLVEAIRRAGTADLSK